jgi:hypothetical protein
LLLLDQFITLPQLLLQMLYFFFHCHACTLLGLTRFGKSPADLGSYAYPLSSADVNGTLYKEKR